jgi:adenylate cyclase
MQRKLASIPVADFVGTTPEMAADEEGAVRRIGRELELAKGCISKNQGRVFNTAGDASHAAIEARSSRASDAGLSPANMRFGLHVADVVTLIAAQHQP